MIFTSIKFESLVYISHKINVFSRELVTVDGINGFSNFLHRPDSKEVQRLRLALSKGPNRIGFFSFT
jgi:hypothetical protein